MSPADLYDGAAQGLTADDLSLAYLNADSRGTSFTDTGKPSYTISQAADQIVRHAPGWSAALGAPFTVTYAFRSTAPATMPDDTSGFSRFNSAQISQVELALRSWADVANINFIRVGSGLTGDQAYSNNAAILLGNYSSGEEGASAFSFFPGSTSSSSSAGDVWVNSSLSYNLTPTAGTFGALVLVHELGHAIGLAHPSDYDVSSSDALTYAADASYYEDDRQYTVMSYFSETETGANFRGAYASAPMLDDIAAAQLEYGPNMSTRTGDTVYGFNSNTNAPWLTATSGSTKLLAAIWDAGGTDTLDFSGYSQNQLIDLRAGDFSNVGGLTGNIAIAQNAVIENAIGGPGADVIHGNAAGNTIFGGAGNDTLDGGVGGRNQILGLDGNDSIVGGADFDDINGNRGDDTVDGGSGGNDFLLGGQGSDLVVAHAGTNQLNGNLGDDVVRGGDGADIVRGGQGNDAVDGGGGADDIWGDLGDDVLTGGPGADTFHLRVGDGHDRVTDFNGFEGDRVQLPAGADYSVIQSGADAVIVLTATGDDMILSNVSAASLPAGAIFLA